MERELVLQIKQGDARAFGQLVQLNSRRAYRTAYHLVGNGEDAADLCQEAFLRAFQSMERFDEERLFYPWLYRILRNLCLNFLKRKKRQLGALASPEIVERSLPGPDEQVLKDEEALELHRALEELSESHRSILVMKHFDSLSYAEMAEILDIPIGTVMSRLYHARKNLAERLIRSQGRQT